MIDAIRRFLRYLDAERNASEFTIKSYKDDLEAFKYFFEYEDGTYPEPRDFRSSDLREFVSQMAEAGYARSTIARRLATLRSF